MPESRERFVNTGARVLVGTHAIVDNRRRIASPLPMTLDTHKLILLLALLVLPLQGLASVVTFVKCHEQAAVEAALQTSGHTHHHDHGDGASHQHDDGDEGPLGSSKSHLCGHYVALHVPTDPNVASAPTYGTWSLTPFSSYTPYFPEHPRRPPRG
jgi:hypothetical protein